ncbi:MAG TPA: preprotein translocase subunit SecA [Candidatus Moranbacteria bacterium]|nr:preprotein translocase subunit SecA [Candidatus Moranbacteria bacterium]
MKFFKKIFGSNEREVKKLQPMVEKINALEESVSKLSDEELKNKTPQFKERIKKGEKLNDLLPEAFAVVREASKRITGERHYDVQLLGGIVLHSGKIAEMKTGEGKTLTSTLPIYLNALEGRGVHVVTVNDYLARRDCNWMGSIFSFLGISTACIMHNVSYLYEPKKIDSDEVSIETENLKEVSRKDAYNADITYGTNNEFGFDYLRDNMASRLEDMNQRKLHYAIVDEVDSILIDEARTPLIISAPDTESTKLYQQFAQIIPRLKIEEDYKVDEKERHVSLTEAGISKVEKFLNIDNLYEPGKITYVHHLEQSLKAEVLFKREKDYIVKDGQVIIVDDFTGRLMEGRRYSEGLHQAIEAKEGVAVQRESRTLATITFQNYFRIYKKLAGMTGTALTSAEEFAKVYKLDVMEIPTHKKMMRKDLADIIYKTEKGKFDAIARDIKKISEKGQPILVGTIAIEKSEYLSNLLNKEGIKHEVLNAKQHEREAGIIADAGKRGSITIATNMAGRGTDIKLGEGVRELGGLVIIGSERHEARRIDNQLRGRAGRQGDPGVSQFYVSLEDELMRRFGGDKMKNIMDKLKLPEDQPIQNAIISKTIESAQSKIEGFNFDIRKHVLDYDDVMNKQREVIYKKRQEILEDKNTKDVLLKMIFDEIKKIISVLRGTEGEGWDTEKIFSELNNITSLNEGAKKRIVEISQDKTKNESVKITSCIEFVFGEFKKNLGAKEIEIGETNMNVVRKMVMLQTIDSLWMNHLDEIDYLRQGIGLRGYGQRDPLIEYKKESYNLFTLLMDNIRSSIVNTIFKIAPAPTAEIKEDQSLQKMNNLSFSGASDEIEQFGAIKKMRDNASYNHAGGDDAPKQKPIINTNTVGRNDPCSCGSGKKYKKCCGK